MKNQNLILNGEQTQASSLKFENNINLKLL